MSKWENGLSVPDAEMLTKISEVLDVPVNVLLGAVTDKTEGEESVPDIAYQLYVLNNQFAAELQRRKRIIKTILIILFGLLIILPTLYFTVSLLPWLIDRLITAL